MRTKVSIYLLLKSKFILCILLVQCNLTYTFDLAGGDHSITWESPNYPNNYPDGIRCVLIVHVSHLIYLLLRTLN